MPDRARAAEDPPTDRRLLRGQATRARVLDAAERLFGARGVDAVSIRDIAAEAGVTLGTVGFHAGSREALIRTVLGRRVAVLSEARRGALATLPPGAGLEALMEAYIAPYVAAAGGGDPQWRAYARLIASSVSDERIYPVIRDLYDPVAEEYLAAIRARFPQADPARLAAAFVMAVAAMLATVASRVRIDALAGGPVPAGETTRVLVAFAAGGIAHAIGAGGRGMLSPDEGPD